MPQAHEPDFGSSVPGLESAFFAALGMIFTYLSMQRQTPFFSAAEIEYMTVRIAVTAWNILCCQFCLNQGIFRVFMMLLFDIQPLSEYEKYTGDPEDRFQTLCYECDALNTNQPLVEILAIPIVSENSESGLPSRTQATARF